MSSTELQTTHAHCVWPRSLTALRHQPASHRTTNRSMRAPVNVGTSTRAHQPEMMALCAGDSSPAGSEHYSWAFSCGSILIRANRCSTWSTSRYQVLHCCAECLGQTLLVSAECFEGSRGPPVKWPRLGLKLGTPIKIQALDPELCVIRAQNCCSEQPCPLSSLCRRGCKTQDSRRNKTAKCSCRGSFSWRSPCPCTF